MTKFSEAQEALVSKNYKLSVTLFRKAIEEEPNNFLAYQGLAQGLLRIKAYDDAITESKMALELNQELSLPHVVMAYANYGKKNVDVFKAEAIKAYELDSSSAETLTCYGIMLLLDRNLDAGVKALTEALKVNPADIIARRNLELAFNLKGDRKKALEQTKKIFFLSPSLQTGIKLVSSFHDAYTYVVGIALLLIILSALLLHSNYLLVVPVLYTIYMLWISIRLIAIKKWRFGLVGILYTILLLTILLIIHNSIR